MGASPGHSTCITYLTINASSFEHLSFRERICQGISKIGDYNNSFPCPNVHDRYAQHFLLKSEYKEHRQPTWLADFEAILCTTVKPGIVTCKLQHGIHLCTLIYILSVLHFPRSDAVYLQDGACAYGLFLIDE